MSLYYRTLIQSGLLLDIYPNAAVAYSLRKLREGYKKVDNLLSYSEDISQTTYQKVNLVTTGTPQYINVVAAPNGTLTADKLIEDTSFNSHFLTQTLGITVVGLDYNFSVYLKAGERIKTDIQAGTVGVARINLLTGVIESSTFPTTPIVTDVGNNWWRFSITFNANSTLLNPLYRIFTVNNLNQGSYVGDGVSGLYVWGFQLTQSSTVLPYEKTVVAPSNGSAIRVRRSVDNAEQDFGFNELNNTLIDWVGYNLWTFSEEWNNGVWTKSGLNTTATPPYVNVEVAPDGTTTADKITENTISQEHLTSRNFLVNTGVTYNVSVYLKYGGRNARVISTLDIANTYTVDVNLLTGTLSNNTFPITPILEDVGSGWYRLSYQVTASNFQTRNVITINLLNPTGSPSPVNYLGDGVSGVFIWGAQITATSLVRTYTKTVATANAGNGFIRTWYDQSGNGRDANQSIPTGQAQIVSNGSFIMIGSKITTNWTTDSYTISAFSTTKPLVSTFVFKRNGIGNSGQCASFANSNSTVAAVLRWLGAINNDLNSYLNTGRNHSVNNQTLGYFLLTTYKTSADFVNIRNNSVELNGNIATGNGTINSFGNANGSGTVGNVNEAILWYQDYVSLIPEIETKINEYYAIY
jgi:hypothetical protein